MSVSGVLIFTGHTTGHTCSVSGHTSHWHHCHWWKKRKKKRKRSISGQTHSLVSQSLYNIVHALLVQALRNLVNRSGKIAQSIFDQLDRRLKSADKKEQSGVRGQGVGGQGREGAQKKNMSNKGPSDNPTHTQPSTVPVWRCMNFCTDA